MTYRTGDIPLSANFGVNIDQPLDAKNQPANTFADLATTPFVYAGLTRLVLDEGTNGKLYVLGADLTTWEPFSGGGGTVSADNGLTNNSGIIELGGALTKATTINGGGFDFTLDHTNGADRFSEFFQDDRRIRLTNNSSDVATSLEIQNGDDLFMISEDTSSGEFSIVAITPTDFEIASINALAEKKSIDTLSGDLVVSNGSGNGIKYDNSITDELNIDWATDDDHIPSIGLIKANVPSFGNSLTQGSNTLTETLELTRSGLQNLPLFDHESKFFNDGDNIYLDSRNKGLVGNDIFYQVGTQVGRAFLLSNRVIAGGTITSEVRVDNTTLDLQVSRNDGTGQDYNSLLEIESTGFSYTGTSDDSDNTYSFGTDTNAFNMFVQNNTTSKYVGLLGSLDTGASLGVYDGVNGASITLDYDDSIKINNDFNLGLSYNEISDYSSINWATDDLVIPSIGMIKANVGGTFQLTDGIGTTANGTAVDIGGDIQTNTVNITSTGGVSLVFGDEAINPPGPGSNVPGALIEHATEVISVGDSQIEIDSNGQYIIVSSADSEVRLGTGDTRLSLNQSTGIKILDNTNNGGIAYADDYSADYTDRSLVDKEFVDNSINNLENNVITTLTPATPNVTITPTATPGERLIGVTQTTAGLLQNVYFTGETVTTSEGTFGVTKISDKGSVASNNQTVVLSSNETEAFSLEFLGDPSPSDTNIVSGDYSAFPILQVSTNQNNQRFKIEAYLCNADGSVTGTGDGPVGTLGVNTILIADSGIVDLQNNNPTGVPCSGNVPNSIPLLAGQRFRYVLVAERIGTGSNDKTVTFFCGSDYNSYFQIPGTNIISGFDPNAIHSNTDNEITPLPDKNTLDPNDTLIGEDSENSNSKISLRISQILELANVTKDVVTYSKAGIISNVTVLETQAGFTVPTGKFYGGNFDASLVGLRFTTGTLNAAAAGDFNVQIRYDDPSNAVQHVVGGGDLLTEQTLISTATALATTYAVSGEVSITPIPLVPNKVYYVDVSNAAFFNVTDLEVELIIETKPV